MQTLAGEQDCRICFDGLIVRREREGSSQPRLCLSAVSDLGVTVVYGNANEHYVADPEVLGLRFGIESALHASGAV